MSASLVGSEMCIRDRNSTTWSAPHRIGGWLVTSGSCWTTAAHASGSWRPVSYTHLTLPTICSV
eukprot:8494752-Alexandrium_andersonii.AAC.1